MSAFEKSHRPERELAQRATASAPDAKVQGETENAGPVHEEARLWRDLGATRMPASAGDAAQVAVEGKGAGQTVEPGIAGAVGAHTGTNLADVRVHKDPLSQQSTRAMGARAFAYGSDVFLGPGESEADRGLMGHELTHVAQQRGRRGDAATQARCRPPKPKPKPKPRPTTRRDCAGSSRSATRTKRPSATPTGLRAARCRRARSSPSWGTSRGASAT